MKEKQNKKQKAASLPQSMVRAQDEVGKHIATLRVALLFVVIVLLASVYGNITTLERITVHIPPDLSVGAEMKVGEYPKANVFTNTAYLWIEFSTWSESGAVDADKNAFAYQEYFGASFIARMKQEYDRKRMSGELDRQRRVTLVPGSITEAMDRVQPITAHSYVVYLDVIDQEWYLGSRVKNSKVRYALEVERVNTTPSRNPIGLKIVGFREEPRLLTEL